MPSPPSRSSSRHLTTSFLVPAFSSYPMPEIRNLIQTPALPTTNTFLSPFLSRDPSNLSVEEILSSFASESRINEVQMELETSISTLIEDEKRGCISSYLQHLGNMSIDEISQFLPEDHDVRSELTVDSMSQESDAPSASGTEIVTLPRLLPYYQHSLSVPTLSGRKLSAKTFSQKLLPVSHETETIILGDIYNWNEQIYFVFNLNPDLKLNPRDLKTQKVSFHVAYPVYVSTPAFTLYKKNKHLILSLLNTDLPPEGLCTVNILVSVNNISSAVKRLERRDTLMTSSFLFSMAKIKIYQYDLMEKYNLQRSVIDYSGQ